MPKLLDLFTGTGSVARVAKELGYDVCTLDIDPKTNPTICADILEFDYTTLDDDFDVVWISCPCETFSAARRSNLGRMVKGEIMTPETLLRDTIEIGVPILRRCQELIRHLNPRVWFIENPYSGNMKNYIDLKPAIYDYCMYGFNYRKRTAIWSNTQLNGKCCDKSHLVNNRHPMVAIGANKKQQGQGGGSSKAGRYAIPQGLIVELLTSTSPSSGSR